MDGDLMEKDHIVEKRFGVKTPRKISNFSIAIATTKRLR
jgi:hypothetical protein